MAEETLLAVARLALEMERPQTKDSLKQRLELAAQAFGYNIHLLGVRGAISRQPVELAISNFPMGWREQYDARQLYKVDPYLRRALSSFGPFRWEEVKADEAGLAYKAELAQAGMPHGITCTFPTTSNLMGMVMFAGTRPTALDAWPEHSLALQLFTSAATRAGAYILEKGQPPPEKTKQVDLTGDERQCLELTAQGLSAKAVGRELRMSEHTVRYHLGRVAAKLDVKTKKEAVTEALHLGLIRKRHHGPPRFSAVEGGS